MLEEYEGYFEPVIVYQKVLSNYEIHYDNIDTFEVFFQGNNPALEYKKTFSTFEEADKYIRIEDAK